MPTLPFFSVNQVNLPVKLFGEPLRKKKKNKSLTIFRLRHFFLLRRRLDFEQRRSKDRSVPLVIRVNRSPHFSRVYLLVVSIIHSGVTTPFRQKPIGIQSKIRVLASHETARDRSVTNTSAAAGIHAYSGTDAVRST